MKRLLPTGEGLKPSIPLGEGRLIYLAGPYKAETAGGQADNVWHATRVAVRLWELGWVVFSPINNTAHFNWYSSTPEEVYLEGDLKFLEKCDCVMMLSGWRASQGAMVEYRRAKELNKEIYFES